MVGHNPGNSWLNVGGNLGLDQDPGILEGIFTIAALAVVKAVHRGWVGSATILNTQLADLKLTRLKKLKAALADVCSLLSVCS